MYVDYLYGRKWSAIRNEIVKAEKDVKFWHFIVRKSNQGLCNQTIRGTREYDGKKYKINKFDIRTKEGVKLFKKLAFSEKESDREKLLVYLMIGRHLIILLRYLKIIRMHLIPLYNMKRRQEML